MNQIYLFSSWKKLTVRYVIISFKYTNSDYTIKSENQYSILVCNPATVREILFIRGKRNKQYIIKKGDNRLGLSVHNDISLLD